MGLAKREGKLEEAFQYGCQGLQILEDLENNDRVLYIRYMLGEIAAKIGKINEARNFYSANVAVLSYLGNKDAQRFFEERLAELDS